MGWDADHKYLADLLMNTGKGALLNENYKDGDDVLDESLYIISRVIRRVTMLARDVPHYGLGSLLPEHVKEQIEEMSILENPEGQFLWSDDPVEAVDLFVAALSDPPSRAIIEGVLTAFKEQLDFKKEVAKTRSQRKAELD